MTYTITITTARALLVQESLNAAAAAVGEKLVAFMFANPAVEAVTLQGPDAVLAASALYWRDALTPAESRAYHSAPVDDLNAAANR